MNKNEKELKELDELIKSRVIRCPKCNTLLPQFQHIISKVYVCSCGGEIYHGVNRVDYLVCQKCRKRFKLKDVENNHNYIIKVLCPLQFDIPLKDENEFMLTRR